MNDILIFFKDFGNLLNTGIILSLAGVAFILFKAAVEKKNAEIELLKERISTAETFSVEHVTEKFASLKQFYEVHVKEWYESSIKILEEEKRKAIESKEKEWEARIEDEIANRTILLDKGSQNIDLTPATSLKLSSSEVCGSYTIVGNNPGIPNPSYFGELNIKQEGAVLLAKWKIGFIEQKFEGVGLLSGNRLAFSFQYKSFSEIVDSGLIIYEILSRQVMRGQWTGLEGKKTSLGFEECRKK